MTLDTLPIQDGLEQAQAVTLSMSDVIAPYILVFFVAWVVTIFVTPLMRRVALHYGIVDKPDDQRKNHAEPVPYLGGVAIFLGWMAGIFVCWAIGPYLPQRLRLDYTDFPIPIIIGAVIIIITGLVDDIYNISPRIKLGGQLIATAMVTQSTLGTKLVHDTFMAFGFDSFYLLDYWLGAAVIAMFIVGGCNSANLLDGLDGLATGVLSIACVGFLLIASYIAVELPPTDETPVGLIRDPVRIVMCLAILGAMLGFLPHNFNPASIFMGDAGSLLLGYLCATTMLLFAHASRAGPVMVSAALIVFALPITDTALAIFRRIMARKAIYNGDNHHLHHQIMRACANIGCGKQLRVKLAVCIMYLLSAVFAALGCALIYTRWRFVMAVLVVFFGFVLVAGYKSGHKASLQAPASDE